MYIFLLHANEHLKVSFRVAGKNYTKLSIKVLLPASPLFQPIDTKYKPIGSPSNYTFTAGIIFCKNSEIGD